MKTKYHDDQKNKHQSIEASLSIGDRDFGDILSDIAYLDVIGYGATPKEADEELKRIMLRNLVVLKHATKIVESFLAVGAIPDLDDHRIVGISGAHGTGKSSTLDRINELTQHLDLGVKVDDSKFSRTALKELGLTLPEATATPTLTMKYQDLVLEKAMDRIDELLSNTFTDTYLIDRSPADIYAYTRIWVEKNRAGYGWLQEFKSRCADLMSQYDKIFLFPTGVFDFVDDGIRAKEDTQLLHSSYVKEFLDEHGVNYHIMQSKTIDDRAHEILKTLNV